MIKTENLQKRVPMSGGMLEILKGITLEIKSGESVAIVGASGSGKSTLLGLLAGLDEASAGRVIIGDTDLGTLDEDARALFRGKQVGFVFQSFQLLPALTALENVMLPLELQGIGDAREQAEQFLGAWSSASVCCTTPSKCQVESSSVSQSPEPLPRRRPFCLLMNPLAIWIPAPGLTSSIYCLS